MRGRKRRAPPFRAIAEFTYDWESWIDPDGRLSWVNAAVERITGYTVDECMALERYPLPLVAPEDRARVDAVFRSAAGGSVGNDVEFRVLRKDGTTCWGSVSWQPLADGDGRSLGFRASVRDIDERKQLEAELRASRARAEAADRAKTELLANVSHELRAPAHCVAGYAELLLEAGLPGPLAARAEVIRSQASLLLRQVEDLLDMASLESGGVSMYRRPLRPEVLLRNAVDPFVAAAAGKGVALEAHRDPALPAYFLGDEVRLSQVLRNLVENAVAHTDHGAVRASLERVDDAALGGPALRMIVQDTGTGIPAERLQEVLRPFVRGDARSRERRGAGLGLSIADRLAQRMGGALTIESEVGRGTTVRVSLPLEASDDASEAAALPAGAALAGADERAFAEALPLRILVVDDTAASRELLAEQLVRLGYAPELAASGGEALERARERPPDVVLVDVQMPDLDGAEVASRLAGPGGGPKVVAVSASTFARDHVDAAHARFDAFLLRPVSRGRLRALLLELFGPGARDVAGEAAAPLLDAAVVADLREAVDASGRSMLERFVPRALADAGAMIAEARGALAQGDRAAAARSIHACAGVVASVGARRAAEALRDLERALGEGRAPRPSEASAALEGVERTLRESAAALGAPSR